MPSHRANKATHHLRVQEALRLLLAGAEFPDILQYAQEQNWGISRRQVQRYQEAAYKQLAEATERDQKQLLGRHLMQRRALYARCLKVGDHRTAAIVLKDEAELEGLYPPTKVAPTTPDGLHPYPGPEAQIPRLERLVRILAAEARSDDGELRLLEQATPLHVYRLPDTTLPLVTLHVLAQIHISEQIEQAGAYLYAERRNGTGGSQWHAAALACAYRFRAGDEGWRQFTAGLGVDPQMLVAANYSGNLLALAHDVLPTPSADEVRAGLQGVDGAVDLPTADELCRSWRKLFTRACSDGRS